MKTFFKSQHLVKNPTANKLKTCINCDPLVWSDPSCSLNNLPWIPEWTTTDRRRSQSWWRWENSHICYGLDQKNLCFNVKNGLITLESINSQVFKSWLTMIVVEYLRHSYGGPAAKNLSAVSLSCGDIAALICVKVSLTKGDKSDSKLLSNDSFKCRKFL